MGYIFLVTLGMLPIPFSASQFSDGFHWTTFDFMAMGVLLCATGVTVALFFRKAQPKNRWPIIIGAVFVFLLIWVELAVGIFGTPWAGN